MGLGRHRSAVHGVASQRQLAQKKSARRAPATDARTAKRLTDLEGRYDRLLRGLARVLSEARR